MSVLLDGHELKVGDLVKVKPTAQGYSESTMSGLLFKVLAIKKISGIDVVVTIDVGLFDCSYFYVSELEYVPSNWNLNTADLSKERQAPSFYEDSEEELEYAAHEYLDGSISANELFSAVVAFLHRNKD